MTTRNASTDARELEATRGSITMNRGPSNVRRAPFMAPRAATLPSTARSDASGAIPRSWMLATATPRRLAAASHRRPSATTGVSSTSRSGCRPSSVRIPPVAIRTWGARASGGIGPSHEIQTDPASLSARRNARTTCPNPRRGPLATRRRMRGADARTGYPTTSATAAVTRATSSSVSEADRGKDSRRSERRSASGNWPRSRPRRSA